MRPGGTFPKKVCYIKSNICSEYGRGGYHLASFTPTSGYRTLVVAADDKTSPEAMADRHNKTIILEENLPFTNPSLVDKFVYGNRLFFNLAKDGMVFSVADDVVVETAANSSIKNGILHGSYVWAKIPWAGLTLVRIGSVAHAMISGSNDLRTAPKLPKRSISPGDIISMRGGSVCIYLGKFVTTNMRSVDGKLVSNGSENIDLWYTPASYSLRKWDGVSAVRANDLYALDLQMRLQSNSCSTKTRWNGFKFSTPDAVSIIGHIDLPANLDNQISDFYLRELRRRRERCGELRNLLPFMDDFSWAINLTKAGNLHQIHGIFDAANILI